MFIAEERRKTERAEALHLGVLASRGDPAEVKKQMKEWAK
jgi:hypothetical protein